MLDNNDIKLVEKAVTKGFRDQDSSNAWERIKKELSGSGQNSAGHPSIIDCVLQLALVVDVLKDYAGINKPLPCGETNKQKFQCLCEIDMLSGLGAPILQINKECPQHGHYCEA